MKQGILIKNNLLTQGYEINNILCSTNTLSPSHIPDGKQFFYFIIQILLFLIINTSTFQGQYVLCYLSWCLLANHFKFI